jgi:hypothetical protein
VWILILILVLFLLLIIVGIFYDNIIPPIFRLIIKLLDNFSKLNLKNPFKSRKGAKGALAFGYSISFMVIFLGLAWKSDFKSKGYIDVGKWDPIIAEGGNALITIYGLLIPGVALLVYSIYLTVYYFVLDHTGEIDQPSELDLQGTLCPKCGSPSTVGETPDFQCKKCGAQVEMLKGYIDRHNGFKFQNREKKNC